MKQRIFTGAGVAIVTPMHKDGSVNYEKLGEILEQQIAGHTDAIIICGTTGESATLNDAEHLEAIRYTIRKVNHRIPVIAGTGSNDTDYAIHLSQEAEEAGADGLLVVTPYYNKCSQRGLIRHYQRIAASVKLPIIMYSVASRTGVNITPQTCYELSKVPNIVAVKEASGNISQIASIKALCGDNLDVYSGNDDEIVPILSLGGIGVISVLSNVMPQETHDICQLYFDGKVQESAALQLKLLRLCHDLFIDVNPIPVKEAMNMMGMNVGPLRMPLCELEEASREKLRQTLEYYHLV